MSETRPSRESRPEFTSETGLEPDGSYRHRNEGSDSLFRDHGDRPTSDRPPDADGVSPDKLVEMHIVTDYDTVTVLLDATARDPKGDKSLGEFIDLVSGESDRAELIEPVAAPDAPDALACVETVLAGAARTLGVPVPEVRWYRPWPYPSDKTEPMYSRGLHAYGEPVIWISVAYDTPQRLAVTAAHELVHYWQDQRSGRCVDAMEHREREGEARRRANVLVPKGTFRTPRGKKLDAWFEPARRRYGTHGGYFCP